MAVPSLHTTSGCPPACICLGLDLAVPFCTSLVVAEQVSPGDLKKYVVVNQLIEGSQPFSSENVHPCICQCPIHPSCRCEAKVVGGVDHELVIYLELNDKPGPLGWLNGDCSVSFSNIMNGCLGPWG